MLNINHSFWPYICILLHSMSCCLFPGFYRFRAKGTFIRHDINLNSNKSWMWSCLKWKKSFFCVPNENGFTRTLVAFFCGFFTPKWSHHTIWRCWYAIAMVTLFPCFFHGCQTSNPIWQALFLLLNSNCNNTSSCHRTHVCATVIDWWLYQLEFQLSSLKLISSVFYLLCCVCIDSGSSYNWPVLCVTR